MPRSLVVKLTAGAEAPERANQAFTVTSTAAASGVPVSLWLTGDAVWFAVAGHAEQIDLPNAVPLADLRDQALDMRVRINACTQCLARRDITEDDLIDGMHVAGAASFVQEILEDDVQAIVY